MMSALPYVEPAFNPPHRVVVLIAAKEEWYLADAGERERTLGEFETLFRETAARGAELLASMDDDYFITGQPNSMPFSMYIIYDVNDLTVIVQMVNQVRISDLCKYFRVEARIGRQLFCLEK